MRTATAWERAAGAVAAAAWAAILLGCMSISIGGRHCTVTTCEDGLFVQNGEVRLAPGVEQDVYYPVPYAHPPNLEVTDCMEDVAVVDQKADRFRVRNTNTTFSQTARWKAKGLRMGPGPCSAPPPTASPLVPVAPEPPPTP